MFRRRLLGLICMLTALAGLAWPAASVSVAGDDEELKPAIREAADRAADFLLKSQRKNGFWAHGAGGNLDNDVGCTALVGTALLATDPVKAAKAIAAAEGVVTANMNNLTTTYAIGFSIVFLERRKKSTGPLLAKLISGQMPTGTWGYNCPAIGGDFDNSNTQVAVLALLVARKNSNNPAVEQALRKAEKHFRSSQIDGAWDYTRTGPLAGRTTPSMTAAGLLGLAVGLDLSKKQFEVTMRGAAAGSSTAMKAQEDYLRDVQRFQKDPQIQAARAYLIKMIPYITAEMEHLTYVLWSLERIAFIYGEKSFYGDIDWYDYGAKILLRIQQKDGSFAHTVQHGANADTCFALLFLRRINLLDLNMNVTLTGGGSIREKGGATAKKKGPSGPKGTPAEAQALGKELETAIGPRVDEILGKLTINTDNAYREALLDAIYSEKVRPSYKDKARVALADRMSRLDPEKVAKYMTEEDAELRLAAVWGAERGEMRELIPNLISRLADREPRVASAAYDILKSMTKQDFGRTADGWNRWWEANSNKKKK